ncbi:sialidase family protein [Arthrobacter sp. SDTb3-6]|uniref:sialidase family protein n=1 Tax=Arthrobacter sp. SDTb3-6 TaxID=2713571 RepID=UPI00159D146B|nr:sialidase family protein [Arthrobacter sp. SDTb3-6]NVM97835.1 hypothetical protein [Arthrobacter sp. SDTb3-6]
MPGPYPYEPFFAVDPSNVANVATNAQIVVYAPGDPTKTPVDLWNLSRTMPLPNPFATDARGFAEAPLHDTLPVLVWDGGGFSNTIVSVQGLKDDAEAAAGASQASADSAAVAAANATAAVDANMSAAVADAQSAADSAATSAALVNAPADNVTAALVRNPATATAAALDASIGPVAAGKIESRLADYAASLRSVRLELATYDGNPSTTHPTVVDAGVAGWNGYRYWMAHTPYPAQARENPSILASKDGVNWVTPAGLVNPVVSYAQYTGLGYDYGSDPELVLVGSKLVMFHRPSSELNGVKKEAVYRMESSDGVTWNSPGVKVLEMPTLNASLIAPSISYDGTTMTMWVVNGDAVPLRIDRRTSTDAGLTWSSPTACTLNSGSHVPWHIGVTKMGGVYYMASNSKAAPANECVLLTSTDGLTWNIVKGSALPRSGDWYDAYGYYRTCLIPSTAMPGRFDVYASTMTSVSGQRSISLYKSFDWVSSGNTSLKAAVDAIKALDDPYKLIDSFDGRVSADSNIGMPDIGPAWVPVNVASSAVRLLGGVMFLAQGATPSGCHLSSNVETGNGELSADIIARPSGQVDCGLTARYLDENNFIGASLVISIDNTTTNRLRLKTRIAGVETTLIDVTNPGFVRGTAKRLKMKIVGDQLAAYVAGKQVATATIPPSAMTALTAATKVTCQGYNDNTSGFDNVSFKAL